MTNPAKDDKWIKDRLDCLQSELFEYSTQNQMGFEDVAVTLKELRSQLSETKRENQELRSRLSQHEARVSSSIEQLRVSMTAPREIVRDENGFISGVRIANANDGEHS